jgi:hypothetical protein
MGMALANQMLNQAGGILGQAVPPAGAVPPPLPGQPAAAPAATGTGLPELLTPADTAGVLGVTEADVLQALGDGSLKGKKIGSAWRITRGAIEDFLKN